LNGKTELSSNSLRKSRVSHKTSQVVAWLIFIAHFTFIARQKIFARGRLDFDTVDTYAAVDVAVVFFVALLLLCNGKTFQSLSRINKSSALWLLVYYMLCALSAMWSLRPAYSLYRAFEFSIFFVSLIVAVSYSFDFEKAERKVLLLSLLSVFLQMGLHIRGGISFSLLAWHTNAYSASAAVIFVYCAGEYLALGAKKSSDISKRKKMLLTYGCLSLALLALGTSSASNVAAAFGIVVILIVQRRIALMLAIIFMAILFFLLGGGKDFLIDLLFPGKTDHGISSLGGRTITWEYYLARIAASPIWGYGLGVSPTRGGGAWMAYSHNFIISILIGTGFLGLTVFLIFGFRFAMELVRSFKKKITGSVGIMGAMAAGFLNSLAMPMIADRWYTASFAFFSIMALFIIHVNSQSSHQSPKPYLLEKPTEKP